MPAVIVAICYVAFVVPLLHRRGGDISRFVIAGGANVDASKVPIGLTVIPGIGGYDGMFFYRLAIDPFTNVQTANGITLDNPAYRQQRIAYPSIVWLLSLGHVTWVPALLVWVNFAAAVAMAAFAGAFARTAGRHALWGVILPLYPGFVLTLSRDLAEIVAAMFAMGAIWALSAQRPRVAAVLLTCAVLTRETALMLAVALLAAWVLDRLRHREGRIAMITFAVPLAIYSLWQAFLALRWGVTPLRSGAPAIAFPFAEFARFFAASAARRYHQQRLYFTESLFLVATVVIVVLIWRRTRMAMEWKVAWLGCLSIFAVLGRTMWLEDFSFLRIFADVFLVSTVLIIPSTATARWVTLIATASLWYYLAKDIMMIG